MRGVQPRVRLLKIFNSFLWTFPNFPVSKCVLRLLGCVNAWLHSKHTNFVIFRTAGLRESVIALQTHEFRVYVWEYWATQGRSSISPSRFQISHKSCLSPAVRKIRKFVCLECNHAFTQPSSLRTHLETGKFGNIHRKLLKNFDKRTRGCTPRIRIS